ncbi:hypothetical protein E2C01_021519 [Portunus trituberculatus]|uniref:Uncharacterized protein n=1 Tax=Portunus trituberculatus TaxID=210409 RepID=A0A5B7E3H0_PORTR|nr:hypothetical protein [Portunus trituberculatus]
MFYNDDNNCILTWWASRSQTTTGRGNPSQPVPSQCFDGEICNTINLIDQQPVMNAVARINGNSAQGPDEMHPYLLKLFISSGKFILENFQLKAGPSAEWGFLLPFVIRLRAGGPPSKNNQIRIQSTPYSMRQFYYR